MRHQQVGVAHREQAGANADRSLGKKGVGGRLDQIGQLHAAPGFVLRGTQHATVGIGFPGVMGGLGHRDPMAVKPRLLGVHEPIEWRIFFARDALAGIEHRIERVARMFGKARPRREVRGTQPVVQQKIQGGAKRHARIVREPVGERGRALDAPQR